MSISEMTKYAKRARAQRTAEAKLDDIAKAIEELAGALRNIELRLENTERAAVIAANK